MNVILDSSIGKLKTSIVLIVNVLHKNGSVVKDTNNKSKDIPDIPSFANMRFTVIEKLQVTDSKINKEINKLFTKISEIDEKIVDDLDEGFYNYNGNCFMKCNVKLTKAMGRIQTKNFVGEEIAIDPVLNNIKKILKRDKKLKYLPIKVEPGVKLVVPAPARMKDGKMTKEKLAKDNYLNLAVIDGKVSIVIYDKKGMVINSIGSDLINLGNERIYATYMILAKLYIKNGSINELFTFINSYGKLLMSVS